MSPAPSTIHRLWSTAAACSLMMSSHAFAEAVIDPDGTGATRVFAADSNGNSVNLNTNGDLEGGRTVLGFSNLGGALELNADGAVTDFVTDDLQVSQSGANADSLLRVVGDGTAGSVTLSVADDFRLGANSDSRLEILNGATVTCTSPDIADRPRAG
jgi:hypothetical protein